MSEPSRYALPNTQSGSVAPSVADPTQHTWESAFQSYYVELCEYVLRFVGSAGIAEDLVHDLFLCLWDSRDRRGGMFEQVARLTLQRFADRLERREAHCACLAGLENR